MVDILELMLVVIFSFGCIVGCIVLTICVYMIVFYIKEEIKRYKKGEKYD